jgi:hypothetical protein
LCSESLVYSKIPSFNLIVSHHKPKLEKLPDTHAQQHGQTGEVSQVASSVAHTVEQLHAVPLAGDKSGWIAHAQTAIDPIHGLITEAS